MEAQQGNGMIIIMWQRTLCNREKGMRIIPKAITFVGPPLTLELYTQYHMIKLVTITITTTNILYLIVTSTFVFYSSTCTVDITTLHVISMNN